MHLNDVCRVAEEVVRPGGDDCAVGQVAVGEPEAHRAPGEGGLQGGGRQRGIGELGYEQTGAGWD